MKKFLNVAILACQEVGNILLDHFGKKISYNLKNDKSPVSAIDLKCEEHLLKIFKREFPDHGFIGEETGTFKSSSEYTWIIDPIDGTKYYIRGIPLFSTLISLRKDKQIILGLSFAPALNELIYATIGGGTYLNKKKVHVSNISDLKEAYLSHGNIAHFQNRGYLEKLGFLSRTVHSSRGIGDAWSYHLLATGRIDIVIDSGTNFLDIAPFIRIVEEAGGVITDMQGLDIGENTDSIIASNQLLHESVLRFLKKSEKS